MSIALQNALQVFLIALLTVLSKFIVDWITVKKTEAVLNTDNELAKKYLDLVATTVTNCVIATNQTYVDSLKDQDLFDKKAQQEAFNKTINKVLSILNDEAINYLEQMTGDVSGYLTTLIEAEVARQKNIKKGDS